MIGGREALKIEEVKMRRLESGKMLTAKAARLGSIRLGEK
jgi:hypothetical protein